jgi:hypothetical protein
MPRSKPRWRPNWKAKSSPPLLKRNIDYNFG